ncbi:MAG: glycosyltransferase [Fibrobacterota bacterium]
MKVLVLHNRYNLRGGEESVFEAECGLLERNGVEVRRLEFTNAGFASGWRRILAPLVSVFNPVSYMKVKRAIREFRPDVVHVHNLFSNATPAVIWAAASERVPVVMTLHNFRLLCPSATLLHEGEIFESSLRAFFPWRAVAKGVYRGSRAQTFALAANLVFHRLVGTWGRVDRFIVLSRFAQEKFATSRLGFLQSRFAVKPNFVADGALPDSPSRERFLFVGRLSPEKGLHVLLEAIKGTSIPLDIVGDGPLRPQVESAAATNPHLRYLGPRPREEVDAAMRSAKALLFPSIWYEGMPMVILESFCVGTPVIASRLGTMGELIKEGVNGRLFEAGVPSSLRSVVEGVLGNDEDWRRMSSGARRSWEEQYAPDRNFLLLREIYEGVVRR